jgi:MGT family glycosyltransferase
VSRFLFTTLPLSGHVNPSAAVARLLTEQGHQVAWCGSRARLTPVIGKDATIYPTGMKLFRGQPDTGMTAIRSLWEGFIVPFARFTLPALDHAVRDYRPDVVVTDQHALAGSLAAQRHGTRWVTLCSSSFDLTDPFRHLPKVKGWMDEQIAIAAADAGLSSYDDPRFSPHLVIVFTTTTMLGGRTFPGHYALVGPALVRRAGAGFPWDRLDPDRHRVLVTVGTMADDVAMDFYDRAVEALRPLRDGVQAVLIAPPEALAGPLPENVIALPRVPQLELLPHLDAVVTHGGLNTVSEALSHGLPLVVAPLTRDQPVNADNVVRAGAGLRLHFHRATPGQLRDAMQTVLGDPAYRSAAQRIAAEFRGAGGAREAAARLHRLTTQAELGMGQKARSQLTFPVTGSSDDQDHRPAEVISFRQRAQANDN